MSNRLPEPRLTKIFRLEASLGEDSSVGAHPPLEHPRRLSASRERR
jgi:hypothetical protein